MSRFGKKSPSTSEAPVKPGDDEFLGKAGRALCARGGALGFTKPNHFVAGRTHTPPSGSFSCRRGTMGSPAVISEFTSNPFPLATVSRVGAGNCMGNLVEEYLVDFIVFGRRGEVARYRDSFPAVVTQPKTSLCMVEVKAPLIIEVESDERFCPDPHPR